MSVDPAIVSYARYRIEQKDVEAFKSLAKRMSDEALSHDGCTFLDVLQDLKDPAIFRFVEGWRDQAALAEHAANPAFLDTLRELKTLAVIDSSIDLYGIASKQPGVLPSV